MRRTWSIPQRTVPRWYATVLAIAAVLALPAAAEGERPTLRVGTSGDYPPFSERIREDPAEYEGFDLTIARAYAADRDLVLQLVEFRWGELLEGLAAGRFDVAMSGVTVREERSVAGRFTVPVVETGAVALARAPERWNHLSDLNRPRVRIGVNAGGHLERVATAQFDRATLLVIPNNAAVLGALVEESVDAVVTDTAEVARWREQAGDIELEVLGPFTRDRKAYLVAPDRAELAADLDAWLLERERDGTLPRLRREQLGTSPTLNATTAHPLAALFAAMDERISLMPLVGATKRRAGLPLEVPEREAVVLEAASQAVLAAAAARKTTPPSALEIGRFYRAQMDAAKQVQWDSVRDPEAHWPDTLPDLDTALRPALLRIGERIASLLLRLPGNLDRATIRAAAEDGLRAPHLSNASRRKLGDAVADFVEALAARPGS